MSDHTSPVILALRVDRQSTGLLDELGGNLGKLIEIGEAYVEIKGGRRS